MKRDSDLDHLGPPRPPSFFSTESFLERWAFLSALVLIGFQSLGAVLLFPARFLRPVESWPNPLYAQDAALVPFLYHIHSTLSAVFFFALGPRLLYAAWRRSHSGARLSAAGSSQLNQRKTPFGSTVSALTRLPLPASDPAISLYWASLLVLVVSGVPAAVTETVYVVGVVVRDAAALLQTAPTHEIEGGWEAVPVGSVARGVLTVAAALLVAGICCAWRRWGESFANWVSAGCTRDRGSSRRTGRLWKRRSNPVMAGSPPSASSAVTSASSVQETPFGWLSSWQVSRRASDAGMDSAEGFTTGGVRHGRRSSVSFKAEAAASGYRGHWLASVLRFLVMGPHCSSQRSDDRPSSITRKVCESLHVYLAVHALLGATWAVFVAEEFPMDIRLALAPVDIGSLSSQDQSNSADSRSSALPHLATATVLSPYLTVWLVITAHIVTATALVYSSYQTALVPPQTQQLVTHKPRAPVNPPSSFQYHQYPPIGLSTQVITQPQFSATPVLCDFCAAAAAASPAIPSSSAASQLPHHTPRGTRTISAADRCRSFTQARTAVVAAHAAAVVAAAASSSSSTSSASSSLSSLSTLSSSASVDGDLDATGATGGPSCVRCGRPVAPSTLDEDPMPLPPPPPGGVPGIPTRRHNSGSPLGAAATASGMGVIEDDCDSARPTTSTAATMASGTPSLPSPSPSLMELGFVSPAAAKMVAAATHFAGATPPPSTSSFTVAAAAPLSGAASSRRHASWGTTHARIGLRMQGALVLVVGFVVTGMVVGWIFVCEASCGRGGGAGGFS
ncbi:hypothetical protein DFJ73DRAFT_456622 [Zopfochytrium polystomum]|nr:hypothetical protein DFJ73DRAFT_456622 [Zopfochytrium polystomum]